MSWEFLYSSEPLTEIDLTQGEEIALAGESLLHQLSGRLLCEVRRLQHELSNPSYQYAGGRIHRHALISRNEEIRQLREKLNSAKPAQQEVSP